MEDPNTFEDMDDILAYYSDSPVLGRLNESHTHSEFAFDEGDWEPEVILGFETKLKVCALWLGRRDIHSRDDIHRPTLQTCPYAPGECHLF